MCLVGKYMKHCESSLIISLPRSGSSYLADELITRTELPYLREPLRRLSKLSPGVFEASLVPPPGFYEQLDNMPAFEAAMLADFLSSLRDGSYLWKETDAVFHLKDIKKEAPGLQTGYLSRHLGGVLSAHMRVDDVWDKWHYDHRNTTFLHSLNNSDHPNKNDYQAIFKRAEQVNCLLGQKWGSKLLAYLAVEAIELKQMEANGDINYNIEYETATNPNQREIALTQLSLQLNLPDNDRRRDYSSAPTLTENSAHQTKITKPKEAFDWIRHYSLKDILNIQFILGKYSDLVFPKKELELEKIDSNKDKRINAREKKTYYPCEHKPGLRFIPVEGLGLSIASRLVLNCEVADFLNNCLEEGILEPHKVLCTDLSNKEIYLRDGKYIATETSKWCPAVYVSPVTVAAYSIFMGTRIPNIEIYQKLHDAHRDSSMEGNLGGLLPTTTYPGMYADSSLGILDFYGNVRELCTNSEGTQSYTFGGSYRDEEYFASSGIFRRTPTTYSYRDIGFRQVNAYNNKSNSRLFSDLRKLENTKNYQERLGIYTQIVQSAKA